MARVNHSVCAAFPENRPLYACFLAIIDSALSCTLISFSTISFLGDRARTALAEGFA
jgi:hypothetical protein